jgi:hypothetical protein
MYQKRAILLMTMTNLMERKLPRKRNRWLISPCIETDIRETGSEGVNDDGPGGGVLHATWYTREK